MERHDSHTIWIVKPGREEEFIRRWSDFEEWSAAEGLSAHAKLLRDVGEPSRLISFGPWETLAAIRRWRLLPGFQEHLGGLVGGNVLCAMLIAVARQVQGRGLSPVALLAMRELAGRHGLTALIAPVRPNWKEHYPLVPIERYATWTRADGFLFDPWMRVHERAGATVLKPEPRSLRITGTVAEWEDWTQMAFPESGDYWFPGGLATVEIDRDADSGSYWEPNVWMHHAV